MRLLIITGLSGSGKTSVLHALEDMGFFCVDNLPVKMLPGLVDYVEQSGDTVEGLAVGIDMRERSFLQEHPRVFQTVRERGIRPEVFFLETTTQVLIRRFEETRRRHPLVADRTLLEGINGRRSSSPDFDRRLTRSSTPPPSTFISSVTTFRSLGGRPKGKGRDSRSRSHRSVMQKVFPYRRI